MSLLPPFFQGIVKNRFFKYGVPFFVLVIGGSFGLREFSQLRYQYTKKAILNPDELEKQGIIMKRPGEVTLETEFEKIKGLANQDWENIRGPRPWEEETMVKNKE